jgi:hypothetical protein
MSSIDVNMRVNKWEMGGLTLDSLDSPLHLQTKKWLHRHRQLQLHRERRQANEHRHDQPECGAGHKQRWWRMQSKQRQHCGEQ